MENDGTDVIRYLMNEMDPSQEVMMERAMMEDDDLLIEVESMRQTLRRLNNLPEKQPSQELTDSILEQAAEQKKSWYNQLPVVPTEVYKYAAVLLLGMGLSSGFWMLNNSSSKQSVPESQQAASVETTLPTSFQTVSSKQSDKIKPWVDHNNVLYYQDHFNTGSTEYQSIIEASMKKVTPLNGSFTPTFRSRHLQMAGAQK